jgi:hypothetical protein
VSIQKLTDRVPTLWPTLALLAILLTQVVLGGVQPVRAAGLVPREIAITDDEAGRQAARAIDKDGADDRSVWVDLRWERDRDGPDFNTGPATIENVVWVAKDISSAKAIYQEQSAKNENFPEAFFAHKGPYPLPISGIGDEVSGMSACLDCNAKDDIFLHHRVTVRRGVVVFTLYLYGNEITAPQSLMTWFATQVATRIPDTAAQAPERAGEPQPGASTPPAVSGEQQAAPPRVALVIADPKDLSIKIGEAGKGAKVKTEKDGTDTRGSWYEVRFEREGSGSRFYQGPVVVHNAVYVARDVNGARMTYQEQVDLNDKIPEADRRIGQKFELKDAAEIGEEGSGISACEKSCNGASEIYVHKRLVSRVANVVSVVYLWGLSHEEGTSDWHARYFGELVVARARAAATGPAI